MTDTPLSPENCTTMAEVRAGVDALDRELVALLTTRFGYMRAAARIKQSRDAVRDEERKARVIAAAVAEAEAHGIPWSVWEYSNPFGMTVIVPEGAAVPDRDLLVALGLAQ